MIQQVFPVQPPPQEASQPVMQPPPVQPQLPQQSQVSQYVEPPKVEEKKEVTKDNNVQITNSDELLAHLLTTAKENDYLSLFGLNPNEPFTLEDINKKRRELTKQLHPDHFQDNKEAQEEASKKLAMINEVYTNLWKKEQNVELYKVKTRIPH